MTTYREQYYQIINFRKANPLPDTEYGEVHHIVPKSLGGTNDKENLVKLTAADHYKAHCILPFMYKEEGNEAGYRKMLYAWHRFSISPQPSHPDLSFIDKEAAEYEELKKRYSKIMSAAHKGTHPSQETLRRMSEVQKGKHPSEETRQRIRNACKGKRKGESNPFFGKCHSQETRQRISTAHIGKHHSEEHKRRISEARKGKFLGEKNPFYGKHHSADTMQKIGDAARGRHWFNNGVKNVFAKESPGPDFVPGILKRSKENAD